jgi:hypothetical protein
MLIYGITFSKNAFSPEHRMAEVGMQRRAKKMSFCGFDGVHPSNKRVELLSVIRTCSTSVTEHSKIHVPPVGIHGFSKEGRGDDVICIIG